MKRRKILQAFGVRVLGWPFSLFAQQARPTPGTRRVGVLVPSTPANEDVILKPFYDGMRDLGWLEGRNIAYERVYAENEHARLPSFVDRILKGERPGDLPVEQISRLELATNAKIAKELGVRIPQSVLLRADRQVQ